MTTTVYHYLSDVDGPKVGAKIQVQLSWNRYILNNPSHEESFVTKVYDTTSDVNGYWEMDLISGSLINPDHALYRVVQRTLPGLVSEEVLYIDVPVDALPVPIGDIVVPKPGWEH